MKKSYLIQRLKKPFEQQSNLTKISNLLSFGGGLINGGLSDDGMKLIDDIFRFDYMGSAEFEWGAVPKALQKIAKSIKSYTTISFDAETKSGNKKMVHAICDSESCDIVKERILKWAYDEMGANRGFTKERVCISENIDESKYSREVCGWLELDNGFFFFTDADMFFKTANLFGVK